MPESQDFEDFVADQLRHTVPVRTRRMFGGVGIYAGELFFAIIGNGRLYFKVDEKNRPDFEREGMDPFRPFDDHRVMQYFEVPVSVLEDSDALGRWAREAIAVAERARAKKKRKR